MQKTILVTGSTDGIGLEAAKLLVADGHHVLLHGRNAAKLDKARATLSAVPGAAEIGAYVADLSSLVDTAALADKIAAEHDTLDVLINNAGVYNAPEAITKDGLDVRFAVNTIAPYLLTRRLLPQLPASARIINLSSAAQAPVDLSALEGKASLDAGTAYAQSKLAITMWSTLMAASIGSAGPAVIAVNPGSLLGSKMVKDAFGIAGGELRIGAEIICRAALSDEFAEATGRYFDNDSGQFAPPHPDGTDSRKSQAVVQAIEEILAARV